METFRELFEAKKPYTDEQHQKIKDDLKEYAIKMVEEIQKGASEYLVASANGWKAEIPSPHGNHKPVEFYVIFANRKLAKPYTISITISTNDKTGKCKTEKELMPAFEKAWKSMKKHQYDGQSQYQK